MSRSLYTYLVDAATSLPATQCVARTSVDGISADNCFRSVMWSPDGQCLATSSEDNTLRIYDYQTATVSTLHSRLSITHGETLTSYSWYPYMNTSDPATCCIATSMRDQPIHLRDTNTGLVRASYIGHSSHETLLTANSVAFVADGTRLLAGYSGHLASYDIQRPGMPVEMASMSLSRRSKDGMKGVVSCIAPSRDCTTMVCGTFSGHMSVRSQIDIGKAEMVWRFPDEYGGQRGVDHIAWSSNGCYLWASGRGARRYLVCWDLRDMRGPLHVVAKRPSTVGSSSQRMRFDFDQSGRHLVAGEYDGSVSVHDTWNMDNNATSGYFGAHKDMVPGVCAHPYYSLLATASGQRHFEQPNSDSDNEGSSNGAVSPDNSLKIWSVSASYAQGRVQPTEMTRLSQFMADCMSVGALRHFSVYIRSREEIVLRVYRSRKPATEELPISSITIYDHVDRIQATEESKTTIAGARTSTMELPLDLSDRALETDTLGVNFLIAGYPRYKCPYVWLRTDHQQLIATAENQSLEKDIPLRLESIDCWRQFDIRPWDVLVEVICTALSPQPENPFAIDYEYFEKITIEERVVSTGAILEFLRRVYLRHYFFSDVVLADIKKLQHQHFRDINTLREFQQNTVFRDAVSVHPQY
ncbi:hypothetical protein FB645_003895 [Coemansia sp. IMI 203386]|nr:hypothetical protein FB645_003895 [Coemansia sp. IMI 203386]